MTTYLLVSVEDKAPIIDQLWKARKDGGDAVTGMMLHALYAYDPAEQAIATEDALKLVELVLCADEHDSCWSVPAEAWRTAGVAGECALGLPPDRFLRAMTRLRELAMISLDTLNDLKAAP